MIRRIVICLAVIALSACEAAPPQETSRTTNPEISIELLFEHDGCRMYRFLHDGRWRYFGNCPNHTNVSSSYSQSCGKSCTKVVNESIDTGY
jgi:hypothetical protein